MNEITRREFVKVSATGLAAAWAFPASGVGASPVSEDASSVAGTGVATDRIERLSNRISGLPPREICFERARLLTESCRRTENEPTIVRRAKAFYAIADGTPVEIDPDELVVGGVSARPRVAYFAPESFDWSKYRPGAGQRLGDQRFSQDLVIRYQIPGDIADYWRDKPQGGTMGHFVADYEKVLSQGFLRMREEVEQCRADCRRNGSLDEHKADFYRAAGIACDAAMRFAARYAAKARDLARQQTAPDQRRELERIAAICDRVPAHPARTFREALQSFILVHALLHINSSEWSISPGRFDQYLWPWFRADLAAGRMTRAEADELLACLWIKFNEVRVAAVDFINYQMVMIGGADAAGRDATNDLSYACLATSTRLKQFVQPSLSLRWHPGTPPDLMEKAGALILTGSGRPALFNDEVIIAALQDAGVAPADARNYAIAGCEEPAVPGKLIGVTRGGTVNNVQCLLQALETVPDHAPFEDLVSAYRFQLKLASRQVMDGSRRRDAVNARLTPHPFVSLLFDDCVRRGLDVTEGGAAYNITSISEAGTITVADSLFALRKVVFEDRTANLAQLKEALRVNFAGHERLRASLLARAARFGNDDEAADQFACGILSMNDGVLRELNTPDYRGGRFVTGSGNSTAWRAGHQCGATPDGRLRGQAASVSLGPTAGADRKGPTAMLNSVARLDWRAQAGGALTHVKLPYTGAQNPAAPKLLATLAAVFFKRGGMGLHFTVVDAAMLRLALKEPEKHLDLLVRLGGFSAPFVLLSPEVQQNIIERTEHEL